MDWEALEASVRQRVDDALLALWSEEPAECSRMLMAIDLFLRDVRAMPPGQERAHALAAKFSLLAQMTARGEVLDPVLDAEAEAKRAQIESAQRMIRETLERMEAKGGFVTDLGRPYTVAEFALWMRQQEADLRLRGDTWGATAFGGLARTCESARGLMRMLIRGELERIDRRRRAAA